MKTTLKEIWSKRPRKSGWDTLVDGLGMSELKDLAKDDEAPDIEVSLRFILENNGWEDCQFAWTCVGGYEREFRLLAIAFAKPFKHLMTDPRSLHALEVAERFANGLATAEELGKARKGAYAAYIVAAGAYDEAYAIALDNPSATAADWDALAAANTVAYVAYVAYVPTPNVADDNYVSVIAIANAIDADDACIAVDVRIKAIQSQVSEFKRLLDCIESGERYEISWSK